MVRRRNEQVLVKNLLGKPGLRPRIDAMCIQCIYDPGAPGTWRSQVRKCTAPACALYDVRPQ